MTTAKMARGLLSLNPTEITKSLGHIAGGVLKLFESMVIISRVVTEIERKMKMSDILLRELQDIDNNFDYLKYMDDVEMSVKLQVSTIYDISGTRGMWKGTQKYLN